MAYSIDATTADCYPGTTCLINKLGIRDEMALAETEAAVVLGKASLLDQHPIIGGFDFDHYKRIHQFLFCDLYDWAGQIRTINISKKGTAFVPATEIAPCADACFKRLSGFHDCIHVYAVLVAKQPMGSWSLCHVLHEAGRQQLYPFPGPDVLQVTSRPATTANTAALDVGTLDDQSCH